MASRAAPSRHKTIRAKMNNGHVGQKGYSVPSCTNCSGSAAATGSNDWFGTLTTTGAVTSVMTFGSAYTNAPSCVVTGRTNKVTAYTPATSTLSITTSAGDTVDYHCYMMNE